MSFFKKIIKAVRILIEIISRKFYFSHERPVMASDFNIYSDVVKNEESVAVVMQGPLVTFHDFTLETIRIYKKSFSKDTKIIVSTWVGEDERTVNLLREEGVHLILNDKPDITGIKNINFQIKSTSSGVKLARELGVTYLLKTRTDQRMYASNIEEFFINMVNIFPVKSGFSQKKRIAIVSLNTFKYRPYSVSDMTLFGHIDDMEKYWYVEYDKRKDAVFSNIKTWSEGRFCEVYLSASFLEKIGRKLFWSLEDSWKAYAEHFCVVDSSSLDLFWYKYEYWKEHGNVVYNEMRNDQELDFKEWLILYNSFSNKSHIPEEILDTEFGKGFNFSKK